MTRPYNMTGRKIAKEADALAMRQMILENARLREAVEKGEYLAQAAGRAIRDNGGAEKFLDLNAAVAEFRRAAGTP